MKNTLLSVGHGFSAQALARRLLDKGWRVIGTTRSAEKADALRTQGVDALIWPGGPLPLAEATHLLVSVAPIGSGDPVLELAGDRISASRHLKWAGYLSTTAVYGDHKGGWVDETTPLAPTTDRGKARARAESAWAALDLPLHIFRLAGIYGPGRGPLEKVRRGTARRIVKSGQVFSRIHVEDIAAVLAASIERPNPGAIYNVCDDEPSPPEDVIEHAAWLSGLPVPPVVGLDSAEVSPMARSFYAESKRVRNNRIKDELGVTLKYPDYRSGLAALLDAQADADSSNAC